MTHLNADGKFQSDKYPTCPPGKVPLSVEDPMAQRLLWQYAQLRRHVDVEFADDLETALRNAGFEPYQPADEPRRFFEIGDGATHHMVQPNVAAVMRYMADVVCDEDTPHVEISIIELTEDKARAKLVRDDDEPETIRNLFDAPMGAHYCSEC